MTITHFHQRHNQAGEFHGTFILRECIRIFTHIFTPAMLRLGVCQITALHSRRESEMRKKVTVPWVTSLWTFIRDLLLHSAVSQRPCLGCFQWYYWCITDVSFILLCLLICCKWDRIRGIFFFISNLWVTYEWRAHAHFPNDPVVHVWDHRTIHFFKWFLVWRHLTCNIFFLLFCTSPKSSYNA